MSKSKKLTSLTDKSFKWDEEPFEDSGFKGVNILAFGKEGPTYYQDPRPWDDSDPKHFDTLGKVVKGFKPGKFDIVVLEQGEIQRILEPKAFGTEKGVKQRKSTGAKTRKVGGPKKGFVQVIVKGDRGEVDQLIRRRVQEEVEIPTGKLADQMLPDISIPSPAKALSAQREAEARRALLQEFGAYTSEEIGAARSKAANVHALASRWRAQDKIFSVDFHGRQLFPGFQFAAGDTAPLPVVAEVLAALPRDEMSDWEVALWWVAANEWLGGERPVDRIAEAPETLAPAAAHLAEPSTL